LGYPCLACVKLFLFLSLYVSFSLSLSLFSLLSPLSPMAEKKVKFKLMANTRGGEISGKIVGFLKTFGDWTFI
jgi:hypothetical protein